MEEALVPNPGSRVGSSVSSCYTNDGCLPHRLGGDHEWSPSSRALAGPSAIMAHKLARDAGSLPGSEALPPRPKRSSFSCPVVFYINHQGGLRSRPLYNLARQVLLWSHRKLFSLRAIFIPGYLNQGADTLSRQGPGPGEWRLHPEVVELLWSHFGRAEVDLFASRETSHCPLWFSLTHPAPLGLDAMVQAWPRSRLYAFPLVALLPGVLERVRQERVSLLLVAPYWPARVWFADLISLLVGSPLEIPIRRDLLSQAHGFILHPRPELWKLWAWPLRGPAS
ncbi:hypothetical protein DPEC_G00332030 [Dallia pectoralis]|uniref:Uncharacterized protein n=1 Tax=Dallia pectoralis TaxID=75939 RepID=A0ACC2F6D2_DALPE|nr:hypothetical protein DPEC_G00332030 [Dallia pectoralis]